MNGAIDTLVRCLSVWTPVHRGQCPGDVLGHPAQQSVCVRDCNVEAALKSELHRPHQPLGMSHRVTDVPVGLKLVS